MHAREREETAKLLVIAILGISVGFIYITILVNAEFGDISSAIYTAISTLFVVPFLGYVVNYVNDQRKNWNETLKTSRETMNKGINKDIEIIRNLIGEFAAHYSSFKPNLYEETVLNPDKTSTSWRKSEIVTSSRILYQETDLLPRKIWEENRREGMIINIPTLRLEKYYAFVELYNRYYSCALKLAKSNDFEVKFKLSNDKKYLVDSIMHACSNPKIGDIVEKTGRTTNFTTGKIIALNATIDVNYGGGQVARFARQIVATNMSAPGDSGSLVCDIKEGAVGLLFAGSSQVTIVNSILYVQRLLRIRLHP